MDAFDREAQLFIVNEVEKEFVLMTLRKKGLLTLATSGILLVLSVWVNNAYPGTFWADAAPIGIMVSLVLVFLGVIILLASSGDPGPSGP